MKQCCNDVPKSLTCNTLNYKCEKFCSTVNRVAQDCGAANKEWIPQSCCSGLICEDSHIVGEFTRYCVEPEANVCARTDNTQPLTLPRKEGFNYGYAKSCGATLAPNTKCCPHTACDHTETVEGGTLQYTKRCVDCASVGEAAAECDPSTYPMPDKDYDEQLTGVKKICCTGLGCDPNTKLCKNEWCAADGKNAQSCGATYANKAVCCENHTCVGKSCVRNSLLPCGVEGSYVKACGSDWATYFICCPGLKCDPNPTGQHATCKQI